MDIQRVYILAMKKHYDKLIERENALLEWLIKDNPAPYHELFVSIQQAIVVKLTQERAYKLEKLEANHTKEI